MQRKATKNTRGPNADEKRFQGWLKYQSCCWCGSESGSIVDHCRGSTFKHNKVLIGHWLVNCNCITCDTIKTIHGKRLGDEAKMTLQLIANYELDIGIDVCPDEVRQAILDWGNSWQNGRS